MNLLSDGNDVFLCCGSFLAQLIFYVGWLIFASRVFERMYKKIFPHVSKVKYSLIGDRFYGHPRAEESASRGWKLSSLSCILEAGKRGYLEDIPRAALRSPGACVSSRCSRALRVESGRASSVKEPFIESTARGSFCGVVYGEESSIGKLRERKSFEKILYNIRS